MLSSVVFLVAVLVCAVISVSGMPLVTSPVITNLPAASAAAAPAPFEEFDNSEGDSTQAQLDSADDASNEVPRDSDSSKTDKKSFDFWRSIDTPAADSVVASSMPDDSTSPATSVESSRGTNTVALGDGQFAETGSGEYQPDPPVFDRNILLKMRKAGLMTRNV